MLRHWRSVACLVALGLARVAGHNPASADWATDLGQELFGSHFELFRGWLYPQGQSHEKELSPELEAVHRRLEDKLAASMPELPNLSIPCFKFPPDGLQWILGHPWFDLVEPCGNVSLGYDGVNFTTAFGTYFVPGKAALDSELEANDALFSKYATWMVGTIVLLYGLYTASRVTPRKAVLKKVANIKKGVLPIDEGDPKATAAEQEKDDMDRMDPDSPNFICKGNMYRLIAVLHPGIIGWSEWLSYVGKAGVCAYMQFYLPYNILTHALTKWQCMGVKSPLYFIMNGISFATQFAALGNVCHLFSKKCTRVIEDNSAATYHLLSFRQPDPPPKPAADPEAATPAAPAAAQDPASGTAAPADPAAPTAPLLDKGSTPAGKSSSISNCFGLCGKKQTPEEKAAEQAAEKAAELQLIKDTAPPLWVIKWNERIWGVINLLVVCWVSVVLQLAIFMKVATFTGDIMNISLIATALYFVFDIDDKVMQSDPKLDRRFKRHIIKLTVMKDPNEWLFIKKIGAFFIGIIDALTPFGLLMIITIGWKQVTEIAPGQQAIIIGGDPLAQ